jgi:hypothetical protein
VGFLGRRGRENISEGFYSGVESISEGFYCRAVSSRHLFIAALFYSRIAQWRRVFIAAINDAAKSPASRAFQRVFRFVCFRGGSLFQRPGGR